MMKYCCLKFFIKMLNRIVTVVTKLAKFRISLALQLTEFQKDYC